MKNILLALLLLVAAGSAHAQSREAAADENTLLWRVSGKDLKQPSYLFGTMHMLCATQIDLSDSLRDAIKRSDYVYLELDMENMQELMSIMSKMKMTGDTTLADLLSRSAYDSVKTFFSDKPGMIPFTMLEKFKPMLAASAIMEADMACSNPIGMEQLIMVEARQQHVGVRGLETMAFQMSIFDSIPYRLQAQQLVDYVRNYGKGEGRKGFELMMQAYVNQRLDQLESITKKENATMEQYMELLLYRRNVDWVTKLSTLMPDHPIVAAVGAGHLPGDRGVLSLLRNAGYTVEPVANNMLKKLEKNL
ncbi:TraB/GumN family protein [Flaviaesturariibacter aridisoli]|uniref:TraB/GumN family protein n=1 Tax=Flaviaesturariibacter aridisoli TaxID=2545761 RepID=A0A4V2WMY1_9BACT|nr:TraB/GumN family protein [Flaviaesturariibacter aridisoli]TCZ73262.1 TraB/GumN family protein [Flaviaesturariibacter aridisoli]